MAIDSSGILHVDVDNETFDQILDNVATTLMDYRITTDGGAPARDVGLLCTSPNINRWAKNKPIKHTALGTLTEQQKADAKYGWSIPAMSWPQIIASTSDTARQWAYERPTGDPYVYRLQDFDGYNRNPIGLTMSLKITRSAYGYAPEITVIMGNWGSTDIPFTSVKVEANNVEATEVALSEMMMMLILNDGTNTYIYNTGKSYTSLNGPYRYEPAFNLLSGRTLKVWGCLAKDANIPIGLTQVSGTTYNYVHFIPLSFSASMEGEASAKATAPGLPSGVTFTATYVISGYPSYYGDNLVISSLIVGGNTGMEKKVQIKASIYGKYSNSNISGTGSETTLAEKTMTLRGSTYSASWSDVKVPRNFEVAGIGMELWLRIEIIKFDGMNLSTPVTLKNEKVYTYTNIEL
jgi:hypothetical protein